MEYAGTQADGSESDFDHVAPERNDAVATAGRSGGIHLVPDMNNVVLLPEGATLDDISVSGRDLVVTLGDGSTYVIANGAVFVPQIVIDGVSVPPMNLAALLTSNEPQPAAGPVSSSGGNFAQAVNPIQDAFELGNLLPYTELAFPEPREEEIYPGLVDRDEEPTISIITSNQPAGVQAAVSTVHEAGLSSRGNKPAGTDASADSETTTGTIVFGAPDGLVSVALNGMVITGVGQTFVTNQGVLTITSITAGSIGYTYTLADNVLGPPADEVFVVTVTDTDGDTATATLTVTITDDAPIARPDVDSVSEDGPLVADGNVLTGIGGGDANTNDGVADVQGADGAVVATTGTFVGQYGTLVLNADGSYVYTLDNANPQVQALAAGETLAEVFPYTLRDGDGDTSQTTLTITINGANDGVIINGLDVTGGEVIVDEDDLASGSSPDAAALTQTGTFTVTSPDGLADVAVAGMVVFAGGVFTPQSITTPLGTLTITGFTPVAGSGGITGGTFTYSYELKDNSPAHGASGEDLLSDSFPVVVTDTDGSSANASLDVTVIDDVPTARDDAAVSVAEDFVGTVGGNVLGNDTQGADGATLTSVTIGGSTTAIAQVGSTTITTTNGVYVIHANGDWTFDPAAGLDNADGIDAGFSYGITDRDGDQATATQPITITDGKGPIGGASIVLGLDDQNLAGGSTPAGADSAVASIAFTPGSDAIASIVFGMDLSSLGGGLTWTRISNTQITGTDGSRPVVTLDLVREGSNAQITATLDGNYDGHSGINIDDVAALGSIGLVATDTDGDTATGTVHLSVSDDLPKVSGSADGLAELTVDETDLTADASTSFAGAFTVDYGADGDGGVTYALAVTVGPSGLIDTASGQPVVLSLTAGGVVEGRTSLGDLVFTVTVDAAGTVTLNQSRAVQHANADDADDAVTLSAADLVRLAATVTDGDGDRASASVNIGDKLVFRDDGPSIDIAAIDGDTVLLTTQDAQTIGGASDTAVSSANFSGAFSLATSSHGADGAGSVAWSFALSVTNPDSGLSSNGAAINLFLVGGVVVGSTAANADGITTGNTIFSLATDAGGVVTLTQHAEIDHAASGVTAPYDEQLAVLGNGLVQLSGTATITDSDGDRASDTEHLDLGGNIRFADDGPAISTTDALIKVTVDESDFTYDASANFAAAFMANFGADGAGDVTYSLAVTAGPSGLIDTVTGQSVELSLTASGVVEGHNANGDLVFTVSVDADGRVTLDQSRAVQHGDENDPDDAATLSAADLVRLTATVTDGDGDSASASVNIGDKLVFRDAIPEIAVSVSDGDTVLLTTQDAQTIGAASDTAVSSANFSGAFTLPYASYRADGAGSVAWSFALSVTNPASGLSSNGAAINLFLVGDVVVGSTAAGAGEITTGNTIFTLATDTDGIVTLTQHAEIDHAAPGVTAAYDDQLAVLGNGLVQLSGTATIIDGDGDRASDTEHLDLGGNIRFADDGPAISASGTGIEVTADESDLTSDTSANFAAAFNINYGADGAGTVVYSLAVTAGSSGLIDMITGQPVALSLTSGGVVEGRNANGDLVFTVSVDADGTVTLDQSRAVQHGDANDPDDAAALSAADLVRMTATVTDGDGDSASATINIGDRLVFRDDGPVANDDAPVTVLETAGLTVGTNLLLNDTLGADNGRLTHVSFDGVNWIGIDAAGTEIPIGGLGIYTINQAGDWTFDPVENSSMSNQDGSFDYRITDADGDISIGHQAVTIRHGGGPSPEPGTGPITAPVTATLDDDGLPSGIAGGADDLKANLGADGVAGGGDDDLDGAASSEATFSGVLGVTYGDGGAGSVSFAQLHGQSVSVGVETATLAWDAATSTLTATGPRGALFAVEVTDNSTGAYKVTLLGNVLHASGNAENDATVALTYSATDGNGIAANGVLNIILDDDKPGIFNTSDVTLGSDLSSTGVFTYGIGGDARASVSQTDGDFTSVALSGLVVSTAITNVITSKTGETATSATFSFSFSYDADISSAGVQNATSTGSISFDKSAGQYTFTLDQPLVNYNTVLTSSTMGVRESFNLTGSSASQPEIVISQLDTDFYVRFSAVDADLTAGGNSTFTNGETIGGSQGWVSVSGNANGVSSDTLQRGEAINLDFYIAKPGASASPGAGTARADGIFLRVANMGGKEDFVVILKLVAPDGSTTTRTVIVDAADVWQSGTVNPYNIAYGNNDSIVIIEPNDYNFGSDNYQIHGVQVLSSTTGLSLDADQTAINLNRAVGTSGASTFDDNFDGTADNDVIKIVDIGLIQRSANSPVLDLDIGVTITDADGDAVSSTLHVAAVAMPVTESSAGLLANTAFSAGRQSREAGRAVETAGVAAAASALIAATLAADVPPALSAESHPAPQMADGLAAAAVAEPEYAQSPESSSLSALLGGEAGSPVAVDALNDAVTGDTPQDARAELSGLVEHAEPAAEADIQQPDADPATSHVLSDGAGAMQAMEALLALRAPSSSTESAPGNPQAAELPAVDEALADARDVTFVDALIDRLGGSADHAGPGTPQDSADIAQVLSAPVEGVAITVQSTFDLAQMAYDASAQAAAAHA